MQLRMPIDIDKLTMFIRPCKTNLPQGLTIYKTFDNQKLFIARSTSREVKTEI